MHGLVASELSIFERSGGWVFCQSLGEKSKRRPWRFFCKWAKCFFSFLHERLFWAHVGHPGTFVSPYSLSGGVAAKDFRIFCFFPGVDHGWPEKDKRKVLQKVF